MTHCSSGSDGGQRDGIHHHEAYIDNQFVLFEKLDKSDVVVCKMPETPVRRKEQWLPHQTKLFRHMMKKIICIHIGNDPVDGLKLQSGTMKIYDLRQGEPGRMTGKIFTGMVCLKLFIVFLCRGQRMITISHGKN